MEKKVWDRSVQGFSATLQLTVSLRYLSQFLYCSITDVVIYLNDLAGQCYLDG